MADQNPNQSGSPHQSGFNMGGQNVARTQQASGFELEPQAASQNAQSNVDDSRQQSSQGSFQQQAAPAESIPDVQLRACSKLIGRNWELMAYGLGFNQHQVDCLKDCYHNKTETLLYMMVKKWHDTVVSCGEDARQLLAACFASEENNEAAEQVIGPGKLAGLKGGSGIKAARTTEIAIQQISFDLSTFTTSISPIIMNVGGQGAFTVFAGSNVRLEGGLTISSSSNITSAQPVCSNEPVRAEIEDMTDSAAKLKLSSTSHQLKKEICDMLSQSQVNSLAEVMKSVCALVCPESYGTAFRVGQKFLITAYHVIRNVVERGQSLSKDTYITFNESLIYNPTNPKVYRITDEYEFDEKLDIAFLIIADPDDNLPKPLALSLADNSVSKISLIGYGHPEGQGKKHLDPGCPVISQNSQLIHDAHAWLSRHSQELKSWYISQNKDSGNVDGGFSGYDSSHNMIINCYSEQGASGGPLVDYRNPNSIAVVGVLTHGLPVCFWELPKNIQEKFPNNYRLEVATRMTDIKVLASKINEDFSKHLFP